MKRTILHLRQKYLSPSLDTFRTFDEPLVLKRSSMQYLFDTSDNKYLDCFGHNMTVSLGHSHPRIISAAKEQLETLAHCSTMFYSAPAGELAERLVSSLPSRLTKTEDWVTHFVTSGSEAIDLSLRMAREYTKLSDVVSVRNSYHGLQGLANDVTSITKDSPTNSKFRYINPIQDDVNLTKTAAILIEPIQGYGGVVPMSDSFISRVQEECDMRRSILIADEVQTGMGRTGVGMWGFERFGDDFRPDIVICAKGLGNGIGLISAVMVKRRIAEAFTRQTFFNTYGSNPTACAVGKEVVRIIDEEGLIESNRVKGDLFKELLSDLELITIRGDGLMIGLDVVDHNCAVILQKILRFRHRIIVGRSGKGENVIRIQPPYCIDESNIREVCSAIRDIHDDVLKRIC